MNIILGLLFAWITYEHIRDAIEPNRQTRGKVRWNSISLSIVTGFLAWVWLFKIGSIT